MKGIINKHYYLLYAMEYSNPALMDDLGYKYIIPGLSQAYRTKKGFEHFKEIYNLKEKRVEIKQYRDTNETIKFIYFKPIKICESLPFWKKKDLRWKMKHFIGLSNGCYVDCYYKHYRNYVLVMRPNPNSKEVYKPYEKAAMIEEWG